MLVFSFIILRHTFSVKGIVYSHTKCSSVIILLARLSIYHLFHTFCLRPSFKYIDITLVSWLESTVIWNLLNLMNNEFYVSVQKPVWCQACLNWLQLQMLPWFFFPTVQLIDLFIQIPRKCLDWLILSQWLEMNWNVSLQ